jgi:hypothetical protein
MCQKAQRAKRSSLRDLLRTCFAIGRRKQAAEEHVCGEIDYEDEEEESDGEVYGSWTVGAMEEGIGDGEIEILVRSDESRSYQDGQQDGGL